MKITGGKADLQAIVSAKALNPSPDSDLIKKYSSRKPPRRKTKSPRFSGSGARLNRDFGAPTGRRSRPETPLLRWKFDERRQRDVDAKEENLSPEMCRKSGRKADIAVSARKLAAGLWRLQLPEVPNNGAGQGLGLSQCGVSHFGVPVHGHHSSKAQGSEVNDSIQSPHSITGPRNGSLCKLEPSYQFSNSGLEGATKWDPMCWKASNEAEQIYGHPKVLDQQASAVSVVSRLEVELEQARARIHDLENERRTSKKKLEQFLKKLSEERATWRSREHEKIRAIIDDTKADLNRERKNRQRMEMVNSKLVNELADTKLSVKRHMQDNEKERKARELLEEVCDELAREIGEDKAEVEALKRESMKLGRKWKMRERCCRWLRSGVKNGFR
ncbi:unnamed protein product [Ilex paraguariensis]|uniref:Uncharacterized protein n=1 Tax=Ilex paraguariensis TaxID=185542 RepID=A0ABC8U9G2_9AQUA